MNFLKSAVASIAQGPAFPYTFGDRVDIDQSIWTLQNGTKREDGSKCSIFTFDINANRSRLALARNALRKFKTIRHPGVVKVLDTVETDSVIYIATERITPLNWSTRRKALSEESIKWGLHNVAKTLKFVNDEAVSVHGNVRASSIFTSESGEWKLAGLELLSSMKEDDAVIFTQGSLAPDIGRYSPPEIVKHGWETVRTNPTHAVDSYNYGILVTEVFSGGFSGTDQIGSIKNIPTNMQNSYKRLTHAAPKMRLSIAHFLDQGTRHGGFFDTPLIQLTDGIDNMGLKSDHEKDVLFSELEQLVDSNEFPEDFFMVKVLPELLKSVEFGGGGPRPFSLAMRIAPKLAEDEYNAKITPIIIRLFASSDRALRVCLLDNLPHMIDHLSQKIVSDKIFPQMVTGFGDLAPVVREQTVKAVLVVVPKLTDRIVNGELLRHLAKTANDEQPGIRTNTTICLGKIARNLGVGSRAKVLTAAFSRALRDPFVHGRNAALMALAATADIFSEEDCATKMLPAICPALVDKEKMIRDQANKTLQIYLERVKKHQSTMPDTVLPPPETTSAGTTRMSTPQPGQQAGSGWAGWAISSFTNKLGTAAGEIQPNGTGAKPTAAEVAAAPVNGSARPAYTATASAPVVPKVSSGLRTASVPPPAEEEDFDASGWGEMNEDEPAIGEDPWAERPASKSSASYDDGGEPDFEGWLNAQAQAKKPNKAPLPKGLAKKSAPVARSAPLSKTTTPATSRPSTATAKPVVAKPKAKPVVQEDNDDWGDAWE
ncbi:Putative protein kinase domain, armadillo-like helical [Septoria linicola]|uniref:Protein kinase domain-containing protein n=1 Tax=Septoria linicola TaxID=215465 RepID=A0A9Q9EPL0_9PEZI|nr:Putative protein kinase domain, armadillo-like helical [Septoria linicola]